MYHGTKRAAEVESLTEADVVLTTYSTLDFAAAFHSGP